MEKENKEKIAVAMSGGVDSSVAAALLTKEYGKENIFGVTMRLFCYGQKEGGPKNCCSLAAINDAKAVCKKLGIKHYVLDFEKEFEKEVIKNFVSEYQKGRTPNPCVRCNSIIKFDYLLAKVLSLGADYLATGHYSRIVREFPISNFQFLNNEKEYSSSGVEKFSIKSNNKFRLLKGKDSKKDQSYFLYGLNQKQLVHTLFPLGEYKKEEVRKLAKKFGLKTAEKVESQEICFIASDKDYHGFLKARIDTEKFKEGEIVDKKGNVLGRHKGLPFYTIGQRRGIGVAGGKPLYVTSIDIKNNRLIAGSEKDLYSKEFRVGELSWVSGKAPEKEFKAQVMIRYNMIPAEAAIYSSNEMRSSRDRVEKSSRLRSNNRVTVIFDKSQKSITPGQSAVFYIKDEVLGGGIISF